MGSTVFGFGSGLGWFLAIASMASIRYRLRYSNVPLKLRGVGITMLLTGLISIAFIEMVELGIIECDEEDFALCSFACPSKIDLGATIRQGLDLMEKES